MIFHRDKLRKKTVPKEYFCHLISWHQKNERTKIKGSPLLFNLGEANSSHDRSKAGQEYEKNEYE